MLQRSLAALRQQVVCETVAGSPSRPEIVRVVDHSGRLTEWYRVTEHSKPASTYFRPVALTPVIR